jgi:hypothetical protein
MISDIFSGNSSRVPGCHRHKPRSCQNHCRYSLDIVSFNLMGSWMSNQNTTGCAPRKRQRAQKSGSITTVPIRKKIPSGLTNPSLTDSVRILEMSSLDSFLPIRCCHFSTAFPTATSHTPNASVMPTWPHFSISSAITSTPIVPIPVIPQ